MTDKSIPPASDVHVEAAVQWAISTPLKVPATKMILLALAAQIDSPELTGQIKIKALRNYTALRMTQVLGGIADLAHDKYISHEILPGNRLKYRLTPATPLTIDDVKTIELTENSNALMRIPSR